MLLLNGFNVYGWDPYNSNNAFPDNKFDIVLLTYVLNILETHYDIDHTLQSTWNKVAHKGMLIATHRQADEILRTARKGHWKIHNTIGFLTNSGTFQGIIDQYDMRKKILNLLDGSSYDIVDKRFTMYIIRKE